MRRVPATLTLFLVACARDPGPASPWGESSDAALTEAWTALLRHRPDRPPAAARDEIPRLQALLQKDPTASCAAGAALYRKSTDGVTRVMIGVYLRTLDLPRGEPYLIHALAGLEEVDPVFPTAYGFAREWASARQERFLPGILSVFKARRGRIRLDPDDAYVETPECMAYVLLGWGPEILPHVRPLLRHADPYVRRNAAFALGLLFDDASRAALQAQLAAGGPAAGGAALALGEIGAREAIPDLISALADPLAENRFWAASALYELRAVEAVPSLREALAKEVDEDAREELEAVVKTLSGKPLPYSAEAAPLDPAALEAALRDAEKNKGYETGQARAIAASAGREQLPALHRIRAESTHIPMASGPGAFRIWGAVIKEVRGRR